MLKILLEGIRKTPQYTLQMSVINGTVWVEYDIVEEEYIVRWDALEDSGVESFTNSTEVFDFLILLSANPDTAEAV